MSEHRARLRVRYYPSAKGWKLFVQRVDAEGVPVEDVLSADGQSKDEAREHALASADDPQVRDAIEASVH